MNLVQDDGSWQPTGRWYIRDVVVYQNRLVKCITYLNPYYHKCRCPPVEPGVLRVCENTLTPYPRHWVWDKHGTAADCVPRELRYDRIAALLQNKRIGLVGDSHMRKLYGYLTTFTETTKLHPSYDEKAHEDFKTVLESTNTSVEFYWRAELRSTTKKLQAWLLKGNPPDFVVMDPSAHQVCIFNIDVNMMLDVVNIFMLTM